MFDFSWAELILIGVVCMVFIGPKDFPKVVRWFADMIKKCRKLASEFHTHVDEMVKDTDLKEAKDQIMQLRHLNVKGAILGAIDRDGSLQDTFSKSPLSTEAASSSLGPSSTLPPMTAQGDLGVDENGYIRQYDAIEMDDKKPDLEKLEQEDPAPLFFPPNVAQRLQIRRASPPSPSMIPPQVAQYKEQRWS